MGRKIFLIIIFLSVLLIAVYIFFMNENEQKEIQLCFENDCFEVELALTPEERSRGLMFREHLEENKGMLFVFDEEGERGFWMKNTLIPLDIIWLNENKEAVFIIRNVQPCGDDKCPVIRPDERAKYVLEIKEGTAHRIGLEVGDSVDFSGQ